MITILAVLSGPSAAATDGTTNPSRADATTTAARTDLRKRRLRSAGAVMSAGAASVRARVGAIAGWSRGNHPMGPGSGGDSGARVGCGAVADWRFVVRPDDASRHPARSVAEAGHELREGRVRAVAVRQDRPAVGRGVDRRPRHANGGVVPGEAQLVGPVELVGHEVQELERFEGEEAVGDTGRDH